MATDGQAPTTPHRILDLSTVTGIWYRRPRKFRLPAQMSQAEYEFAATEARRGFGGIINSLTGWINHPSAIGRAEYKPYQLHHAVQAGLNVPRTLITNDPKQAKGWCARVGDVVYKPLSAPSWLENGDTYVVFTTPITPDQWGDPAIGRTAHMFQQRLDKEFEVRLTMVDGKAFPRHPRPLGRGSYRLAIDYDALTYSIPTVPQRVQQGRVTYYAVYICATRPGLYRLPGRPMALSGGQPQWPVRVDRGAHRTTDQRRNR